MLFRSGLAGAAVGFGAAASPALVRLLLGPQWSQAESLLPLVAAAHGLGLVTQQIIGAAESVGRVKERLHVQAVHTVINVALISFMFLTTHSPLGVATGWLGGEAIRLVGHMRFAVHHLDASAPALIRRTLEALLVAALAGVAPLIVIHVLGLSGLTGLGLSSFLALATLVCGYRFGWIGALRDDLTRLGLGDRMAKLRRRRRA